MATFADTIRVAGLLIVDGVKTSIEITYESVVTMIGLETAASCLGSPFNFDIPWMPFIGVGRGQKPVSTEDRHLDIDIHRKLGVVSSEEKVYKVFAKFEVGEPEDAYILREVGIFDKIVGGRMAARFLLDYDIEVAADDIVEIAVFIYAEIGD